LKQSSDFKKFFALNQAVISFFPLSRVDSSCFIILFVFFLGRCGHCRSPLVLVGFAGSGRWHRPDSSSLCSLVLALFSLPDGRRLRPGLDHSLGPHNGLIVSFLPHQGSSYGIWGYQPGVIAFLPISCAKIHSILGFVDPHHLLDIPNDSLFRRPLSLQRLLSTVWWLCFFSSLFFLCTLPSQLFAAFGRTTLINQPPF